MFSAEEVPEDIFPTMLEYLEGLKGLAKTKSLELSQAIIDKDTDEVKLDRAKQVLQILT